MGCEMARRGFEPKAGYLVNNKLKMWVNIGF